MRKLCKNCQLNPVAINYHKDGKIYYRRTCDHCAKKRKANRPLWALAKYQKKDYCEKCNFASKHSEQFNVFYIDGNLHNNRYTNLKTVCANCQRILHKEGVLWRQGDLTPDF